MEGDGYVHYLDCSDGSIVLCFKFVQFILCQLYLNKAIKGMGILDIFHMDCLYADFQSRVYIFSIFFLFLFYLYLLKYNFMSAESNNEKWGLHFECFVFLFHFISN